MTFISGRSNLDNWVSETMICLTAALSKRGIHVSVFLDLLLTKYLYSLGGGTAVVASSGLDNNACCLVKVNAGIGLSPQQCLEYFVKYHANR